MATTKTIQATVKNRTDTAANWTQKNPVLAEGEIIVVQTSTGETRLKIGDGVKSFTQLPYTDEQIYNNVVTSVNGQTGDITTNSVEYTPQTLTDEQKKQARENIAAMRGGYANQMYNASDHGLDIYSVAGSGALCNIIADIGNDSSGEPIPSPALMVCAKADRGWISAFLIASNGRVYYSSFNLTNEDAPAWTKESSQIMLNNGGALEQQTMASAPTSDMQIATKKYVDNKISDKEIILSSSTVGSTKKFKLTIDDTGTLTASEITA